MRTILRPVTSGNKKSPTKGTWFISNAINNHLYCAVIANKGIIVNSLVLFFHLTFLLSFWFWFRSLLYCIYKVQQKSCNTAWILHYQGFKGQFVLRTFWFIFELETKKIFTRDMWYSIIGYYNLSYTVYMPYN